MSDIPVKIEALCEDGTSMGLADLVVFRQTSDVNVCQFEAIWPQRQGESIVPVCAIRIDGRLMMIDRAAVGPGEALRVRGYCNARTAQGRKLDG